MIFLSILKIIGHLLLFLLLFVLFVLLYCLFLPLHYEMFVKNEPEREFTFRLNGYGFLKFWQIGIEKLQGEYLLTLRAFWGKLTLLPKKESVKKKRKEPFLDDGEYGGLSREEMEQILSDENVKTEEKTETKKNSHEENAELSEKNNFKKKKRKTKKRDSQGFSFSEFHNKWKDEHNKKAVDFLLRKILWLLKKTKPKILHADVDFSLGDPAVTGMATGLISLCPGCYGKKTRIIPDFESEKIYVNGWIQIKGIVFLIHIVYLIISVLCNKDCRKCLKK